MYDLYSKGLCKIYFQKVFLRALIVNYKEKLLIPFDLRGARCKLLTSRRLFPFI